MNRISVCLLALPVLVVAGCAGMIDLLQGHVEGNVAGHHVLVTDCYRTDPPKPERLADQNGVAVWKYAPCRDAVITLRGTELEVNGRAYGALGAGDEILVDHGKVSVNRK